MDICKINLCEPEVQTDVDSMADNSGCFTELDSPGLFAVEINGDNVSINVNTNDHISEDDTLAYINNVPLKSKMNGNIIEKTSRYFIGEYSIDENQDFEQYVSDIESIGEGENDSMTRINNLLKENMDVVNFIKDFILRFRFADIATHTIENVALGSVLSFESTHRICEQYKAAADDIISTYENNVRNICDSDNVKTKCDNDKLLELKQELDNEKKTAFEKILNQYNNIDNFGYNSGKISDYLIYDEYMDYITSDNFYYDPENPYIVELFHLLNDFLKVRERIENNSTNVSQMIIKFNDMCDDVLHKYWNVNKKDYYGAIKEIFFYDFYADNSEDLIEAKINDEKRVTLYSKVLDYLQTLTSYVPPISKEDQYVDTDVQTLINSKDKAANEADEDNARLLSKLKKIAISFVTLRKLETEMDPSFYEEYISEKDLSDIFTLRDILSKTMMTLDDYTVAVTANPAILQYREVLQKYLGMLKGITNDESMKLKELSDRAINWYKDNSESIDNGDIFKQFNEISWPSPTLIRKDGKPCDFYFIDTKTTETTTVGEPVGINPLENYVYGSDSLFTQFGIDSYGYWLKYCAVATIVNCMLPMYWSTGLVIAGAPIKLPIIFIPIIVISKRVITVIGLGICGICPLPMILFMNIGDVPGYTIPFLNIIVDKLKAIPPKLANLGNDTIKGILKGLIKQSDNKINDINSKISDLNKTIQNLEVGIDTNKETLRALKKKNNIDSTSNKK